MGKYNAAEMRVKQRTTRSRADGTMQEVVREGSAVRVWKVNLMWVVVGDAGLEPAYRQAGLRPSECKPDAPQEHF